MSEGLFEKDEKTVISEKSKKGESSESDSKEGDFDAPSCFGGECREDVGFDSEGEASGKNVFTVAAAAVVAAIALITGRDGGKEKRKRRRVPIAVWLVMLAVAVLFLNEAGTICLQHKWRPATCETPKTCWKCGFEEGEPNPDAHGWNVANCAEPKTCVHCKKTEGDINPNNHQWGDTSDQGYMICELCGKITGNVPELESESE